MTDTITLTGLVATPPRHITTSEGLAITNFRMASTQRRYDRDAQKWIDGETNWYTVTCFRQLAINVVSSLSKGQRIVVTGRLRLRDWQSAESKGTNVEIDAEALGHDLAWGSAVFTRSVAAVMASGDPALSGDRAAVLDTDDADTAGRGADMGGDTDTDEHGDTDSAPVLEAATPF